MIGWGAAVVSGAMLAGLSGPALAGAWVQPKGEGQIIAKIERMKADEAFGPDGQHAAMDGPREDQAAGVFAEYGLTERLTVQFKGDWQSGHDPYVDYEGRGPVELGVTWQALRTDRFAASLYAGYARGGEGRNAGYAAPGVGDHDWEVRASAGMSLPREAFMEAQVARRMRDGLPDETRIDLTAGGRLAANWMALGQVFAGAADGGARWASVETSVVRRLGRWSLQLGWRQTVAGRETPAADGPVLAIWRRF